MTIENIPDPSKAIIKCPDCKNEMGFLYELNLSLFQCPNCKTVALCHVDGEGEFYIVSANRVKIENEGD